MIPTSMPPQPPQPPQPLQSVTDEENQAFHQEESSRGRPELAAWQAWKDKPTPENMGAAVRTVQPIINKAVARFPKYNPQVLGGHAKQLTIQALKTYDPAHGASITTHIFNHLLPLGRRGEEMTRVVSMPRSLKEEVGHFVKAERDFTEKYNREPSDAELMDHLKIPRKKLEKLRHASRYEFAEGQAEELPAIEDEDQTLSMWTDYVYHDLDPAGKAIMDHKMGRNGRPVLSTEEIAAKLKLHPTYVNRRAEKIAKLILDGANSTKNRD